MLFENRRYRYKELAENKAEAYWVYGEHLFSACDAGDARLFSKKPEQLPLELTVKVFNINTGKDNPLLRNCKTLDEYSLFVEEVRIQKRLDPENGFTNAVKICIQKGILKEYLERKSREVINMLVAEYDYDTDIAIQRKESLMLGIQQGRSEGKKETASALKQMGLAVSQIVRATGLSTEEIEAL